MTRILGEPRYDYVILSEGNTSARIDEETFWVKGSGSRMTAIDPEDFVRMRATRVLELLGEPPLDESETRSRLAGARVDPNKGGSPSIETAMHALCLTIGRATYVGHTHPPAINAILCARDARLPFSQPIFPAESLVCGRPVFVPYAGPGQPLALAVQEALESTLADRGEPPRVLLLQNHGMVVLGGTPQEVLDATRMMVKSARILLQTFLLGGPRFVDYG